MTRRERRELLVSLGISVAVALLLSIALRQEIPTLKTFQTGAGDFFFQDWSPERVENEGTAGTGSRRLGAIRNVADEVVIVAIDDDSIQQLGRHGDWPRRYYAEVVDQLSEGGARVIAFDIGFTEPHADDGVVVEALNHFVGASVEQRRATGGSGLP